ncbi:UNVERIFIED_CONTAM: Histone deacetylase complex subunit SAP18 [Sesamum calycinum]|uniref:Histone deacetylase complex subunit SAP18 n=1 Tax=Sesamum calycinum TaxID=2727403 RepID=A0AAW2P9W9_9LAMI
MATRLRAELKTNTDSRVMAEGQRRPGRQMPPPGRGPPPPPPAKPAAPRLEPVDREKTCPLLLRVFTKVGSHHSDEDFAVRGKEPKDEVQIYTWMDATLRELTDLVKEVAPEARREMLFCPLLLSILINVVVLWLERCNSNYMIFDLADPPRCLLKVGRTFSYPNGRRPDSGSKALGDLSFQIGDYLDVAILTQ